jgi:hypothetical protein
MLDEDIELTKGYIRQVILATKLKVELSWELIYAIEKIWDLHDDAVRHEYRMLYRQVEKEMRDAP